MPAPSLLIPALLIPAAFLSGSVPFGLIIARSRGVDIRTQGSGNIGATNVGRVLGRKWGLLCFGLDALKGFAPTFAAGLAAGWIGRFDLAPAEAFTWLAIMLAAILGHVFCPWLRFKGGKGVATGLGAMLGVCPPLAVPALASLVLWAIVFRLSRTVSVASLAAALSLPALVVAEFALWVAGLLPLASTPGQASMFSAFPFVLLSIGLVVLVVYTHRSNIARLRAGKELKFREKTARSGAAN